MSEGKGDCYKVAAEIAGDLRRPIDAAELIDVLRDEPVLVHGEVTGSGPPITGRRFGHAWVEVGELVLDFSNGRRVVAPRNRYYEIGQVREEELRRFTPREVRQHVFEQEHWGPW